jgi:hypothetical protein
MQFYGMHRGIGGFGGDSVFRTGAPRPMKMGTIVSPWRYDVAVRQPLRSVELRRTAILHYASQAEVFPKLQGGPVTRR